MEAFVDRFEPGQVTLYREIVDRVILDVKPVTVVEDTDDQLLLWLPLGTPSKRPVLLDHVPGTPRRWTDSNWELQDSTWQWAELLIVIHPDQYRATWVRWSENRDFLGWCVNMQSRLARTPLGFDFRDHQMDLTVEPDRWYQWKDQAELDICVEDGRLQPQEAESIREEGDRAIEEIERKVPFL